MKRFSVYSLELLLSINFEQHEMDTSVVFWLGTLIMSACHCEFWEDKMWQLGH